MKVFIYVNQVIAMLMAASKKPNVSERMSWPIVRIIFLANPKWFEKLDMLVIEHNSNRTAYVKSLIDKAICEGKHE
jgi:hypothetical protein